MQFDETTIEAGGLTLAVKTWGEPGNPAVLALHGWQDNAATFDKLAPCFPDLFWVMPDLPGHGLSEHRGKGAEYSLWGYGIEAMAVADAFGLDRFILVGHSMGGGIACLLAALFPERIDKLVLLDVLGAITTPPHATLEQMRKGYKQRLNYPLRKAGIYATREEAVTARARRGVSEEGAALLGRRGIDKKAEGYYWRHDQRLTTKSLLSMSDEQGAPFLEAICCPVLLVTSKEAVIREEAISQRATLVSLLERVHFAGGHHQHLDGDVTAIADSIKAFLVKAGG